MRLTLLEMTQDILSDMDSDEVDSIDDTVEATQVAQIIKTTYLSMMSNRLWPHLRKSVSLVPSYDATKPTHMSLPDNFVEMSYINYNKEKVGDTKKDYRPVQWLEPDQFMYKTNMNHSDADGVMLIEDYTGVEVLIRNDGAPEYYTSFDDKHLIFNSYDAAVDSTLQESKVQAQAYVFPDWVHEDDAVPDLPTNAFMALLEEAKSRCMRKLKQMPDQKSEQEARRQQGFLSRRLRRNKGGVKYPNYGRK